MLGREPGAFLPLHEPLSHPGLGDLGLAEPPSAAKRLEAMRLQGPMRPQLTGVKLSKRYAPPIGGRENGHRELARPLD
jgi:hypothetical protein